MPSSPQTWARDLENSDRRREAIDDNPPQCALCGKTIPKPRRYMGSVKYCTPEHTVEAAKIRLNKTNRKNREAGVPVIAVPDPDQRFEEAQTRRGPLLKRIRSVLTPSQYDAWVNTEISNRKVSHMNGVDATAVGVGMARKAAWNDSLDKKAVQTFAMSSKHKGFLGPSDDTMRNLLAEEPDVFAQSVILLAEAFVDWRAEFFKSGQGQVYITKEVHIRWIRATLETIYTGGRLLILSPPRHGKTDLLIHFCVWLICRNPDIRILWVGPNSEIGDLALGQVRNILEAHNELIEAYLPLGETWAPIKGGNTPTIWQASKFTVANRTYHKKQPTMWSTGVSAKISSIDADFIVVDDPADPDHSQTVGGRAKIETWFKLKLISRKMDQTGVAMISSRVHPEDLYSLFVESNNWQVLIDRAHDQAICGLGLWDEHKNVVDCVLFPELNPLRYLREQAQDVGDALFEMMYLNQPRPDDTLIFDPDIIREKCLDFSRDLGTDQIPGSYRLVAGLDPAARGVQAAFLWAVKLPAIADDDERSREVYHMVDLETQHAGGMEGVVRVMTDWHKKYGVTLWIIEDNSYQQGVNGFDDPRLKAVRAELGLDIKPTHTGKNKNDKDFGVAGMATLFHEGRVVLPYATMAARRKSDAYIRQLVNFTGESAKAGHNRKTASDILMAAWFPFSTVIRKWKREERRSTVTVSTDVSYPGYSQLDENTLPWGSTPYPGG